ncbi:hypothetical protein H9P43_003019 [Blastocladiella emersonii ATCC 22665]|nr:hypothetical protein H9P43_003019 [Blastocladiella emersonii ATCC 22665]
MPGLFDLESQFIFYGAYHKNGINKLIHIICVPLILWSLFVWLSNTGELVPLEIVRKIPPYQGWVPEANGAFLVGLGYLLYYLCLEPIATLTYAPMMLLTFVTAGAFAAYVPNHNWFALYVHLASWAGQIVAHYVFEKRAPAFFDSVHQAFVMAPLFVWMEVLFVLGYNPELAERLDKQIDVEIAKFRATQKGGKAAVKAAKTE